MKDNVCEGRQPHSIEQQTELRIPAFKSKERGGRMCRDALFKFQWSIFFASPLCVSLGRYTPVFHSWGTTGPPQYSSPPSDSSSSELCLKRNE